MFNDGGEYDGEFGLEHDEGREASTSEDTGSDGVSEDGVMFDEGAEFVDVFDWTGLIVSGDKFDFCYGGEREPYSENAQSIDKSIEPDGLNAGEATDGESEEHVTDVGDGAVGEEAFPFHLSSGGEGSESHRGKRDEEERELPEVDGFFEGREDANEECDLSDFRYGGEVDGRGGRGSFVDVGCPGVEGYGGHFEEESGGDEDQAEESGGEEGGGVRSGPEEV